MDRRFIKGKVIAPYDISRLVKGYIDEHTNQEEPPFGVEFSTPPKRIKNQKVNLTDWRKLYNKSQSINGRMSQNTVKQKVGEQLKTSKRGRSVIAISERNQSYLASAMFQNLYETEIFTQKRAQTAKVKRHYESRNSKRPASIAWSRRKMYDDFSSTDKQNKTFERNFYTSERTSDKSKILTFVRTEKFDKVKIKPKHIMKQSSLKIQNISKVQHATFPLGFRYNGSR